MRRGADLARRPAARNLQPMPPNNEPLRRRDDSMIVRTDALTSALLNLAPRGERTHCNQPETTTTGYRSSKARDSSQLYGAAAAQCSPSAETQPNNVMNGGVCGRRRSVSAARKKEGSMTDTKPTFRRAQGRVRVEGNAWPATCPQRRR